MVLRAGHVTRRTVRIRRSRENPFEHLNNFNHFHIQAGFFSQFPYDALLQSLPHLKHPPGIDHWPWSGGLARRISSARIPSTTTPPTPTNGCSGYSRLGVIGFCALPSRRGSRYIIRQQAGTPSVLKEDFAVVRCPKCATEIDVDEDEVEEGEILVCLECETEMEVVQIHPVKVNVISDDDDEDDDEDEESEDGDDVAEDDDDPDDEEDV